jgi:hypothetical protein
LTNQRISGFTLCLDGIPVYKARQTRLRNGR